uniref:Uncharacterized protein n=1 Tax=Trichuris muris TaxID=70415 RepID=A0A5S6R0J8_TRIMR
MRGKTCFQCSVHHEAAGYCTQEFSILPAAEALQSSNSNRIRRQRSLGNYFSDHDPSVLLHDPTTPLKGRSDPQTTKLVRIEESGLQEVCVQHGKRVQVLLQEIASSLQHVRCSEEFYRNCVLEELKSLPGPSTVPKCSLPTTSDLLKDASAVDMLEEKRLDEMLTSIGVNVHDDLFDLLTGDEKEEFLKIWKGYLAKNIGQQTI